MMMMIPLMILNNHLCPKSKFMMSSLERNAKVAKVWYQVAFRRTLKNKIPNYPNLVKCSVRE